MEQKNPFSGAQWIGADADCQSPVILRSFTVRRPAKAALLITGLGYFHAQINGTPVTGHRLQPVCSEYAHRDLRKLLYPLEDSVAPRIYYCSYDITPSLQEGANLLTIQLGNGWYRQTERNAEGAASYGQELKTIYTITLHYPEGEERICSDGSETWIQSPVVYNNLFIGEIHNYNRTAEPQHPVHRMRPEEATLSLQEGTPDKVIRRIQPKLLHCNENQRIYDAGENISGVVRFLAEGRPGETITLRFAENLSKDGQLDFESTGSSYTCASGRQQIQTDVCICGEKPILFEPLFCWHGFRYFEVAGPAQNPEVLVIHADAPVKATFSSDCEGMNFLFEAFIRTQLSNMHGSIPSDCPHRERLGYTGDGQIAAAAAMMTLDCQAFYRKWMQDILDTQDPRTGHIQHTAPLGGGGGGPVGWGGAVIVIPYRYFKQYGSLELLAQAWPGIEKWLCYLSNHMDQGLIVTEEPGGWCLGDWATREPTQIPEPFVNTCLLIRYLDMLREAAPLINKEAALPEIEKMQNRCRNAVIHRYYDAAQGQFCGGIQGADAFALAAGLGDSRTLDHLMQRYHKLNSFDTGFIGTDLLIEVLLENHCTDLAWELFSGENMGSFLYMKRRGATTLWEHWDGSESHSHPMFGGCVRHLFEGFLGIRQAWGTGGYQSVLPDPQLPSGMNHLEGSLQTPRGTIHVVLKRENGNISKTFTLP